MPSLTFLGSGVSFAVPAPGCNCLVCRRGFQPFSKLYRTRASVLVQNRGKNLLIDCSPDFREQALKNKLKKVDAALISHLHADATWGIVDLRAYSFEKKIPVYANAPTIRSIRKHFDYAFSKKTRTSKPELELKKLPKKIKLFGLGITPVRALHPPVLTHGFRINDLAYLPDVKKLPVQSKKQLKGIKTLIIDATSNKPYIGHQTIFDAIKLSRELGAKKTYFTHIGHDLNPLKLKLPRGMQLAYDGLKIRF